MNRLMLPYPVSANRYWRHYRGMVVISKEALLYQSDIKQIALLEGISKPLKGSVHVEMTYYPILPKKWKPGQKTRSQDISNVIKVAEDALNGIAWVDDKQITHLSITKGEPILWGGLEVCWKEA